MNKEIQDEIEKIILSEEGEYFKDNIIGLETISNGISLLFDLQNKELIEQVKDLECQVKFWTDSSDGFKNLYIQECKENNYHKSILGNYQTSHNSIMELNKDLQSKLAEKDKEIYELKTEISVQKIGVDLAYNAGKL